MRKLCWRKHDQLKDLALTVLLPALVLARWDCLMICASFAMASVDCTNSYWNNAVAFVIVENGTIGTPFSGGDLAADAGNGSGSTPW
jgi:hypothetical protein